MEKITSATNSLIKNLGKLNTKHGRQKAHSYLLDGRHLVEEALKNGQLNIKRLIVTSSLLAENPEYLELDQELVEISDSLANKISETQTPQGIFAEVEIPKIEMSPEKATGAWLFLDGIQDPGNLGTMVRTADAAGFVGVVAGIGSTDIYASKAIRSMQGSQFHIQVLNGDLTDWAASFRHAGRPVYGTELNTQAVNFRTIQVPADFALVVGNEGNGMDPALLNMTTENLYIPMKGKAESLNVAVAAGVIMMELTK